MTSTRDPQVSDGVSIPLSSVPSRPDGWQRRLGQLLAHNARFGVACGLVIGVMGGLLAGSLAKHGQVQYTSTTVMMLDDPLGIATAGDEGALSKVSDLRYKYASLAATDAIAQPVAAALNLPVAVVLGSVNVVVPTTSLLMNVVATSPEQGFSTELSAAVASEITKYIKQENTTFGVPSSDQIEALTLNPAQPSGTIVPSTSKAVLKGVLVLLGGFVLGFVVFQLLAAWLRHRSL